MTKIAQTSYDQNGFYVLDQPVLGPDLVAAALEGMDMLREGGNDTGTPIGESNWKPGDDPTALCKIDYPQIASKVIKELIGASVIGECAVAVTGARMVQVWAVQLLYKPPTQAGATALTNVGWHQDWNYWNTTWEESSELFTAWVALSDVSEDSGPMKFVRRSHQWKDVGGGDFFSQHVDINKFSVPDGEQWQEVPAVMRAGGLSLHHKHTLHGSGSNTSKSPRRSLAIHLRTEKSRPVNGGRAELTKYIDDLTLSPIIYGERVESAFS